MTIRRRLFLLALMCLFVASFGAMAEDPWADAVVSYTPGDRALLTDASLALGEPLGSGPSIPNNSDVLSLGGVGGVLTLKFNTPVTDDSNNPFGLDFIVYSNAFWVGANPQVKFEEPAIVEISEDVNGNGVADDPLYLIPGSRGYAYSPFPSVTEPDGQSNSESAPYSMAGNIRNPNMYDADSSNDLQEYNWGYCELTPTAAPYLDNYVRPDDPLTVGLTSRSGGGDAFDIAWAVDEAGAPAGITKFSFLRITSFISRAFGALGYASPEIAAAADVAPAADSDSDGILDDYETRVAGTDPERSESTILPLEIPSLEGGSPYGTVLGVAHDSRENKLRLYAANQRTSADRAYSVKVDIVVPAISSVALPDSGFLKSGCALQIDSSESDFVSAGVQAAEIVMHYSASEIAGLDESGLRPFLFTGGAFTQSGVSDIVVNAAANLVTFRSRYAGVFVLASVAGSGDDSSEDGPQGAISLTAFPEMKVVADPVNMVTISSGAILDGEGVVVEDGAFITVATTRGSIATSDADPNVDGVQVATSAGSISFSIAAPKQSGAAVFSATSVTGSAYGEIGYTFSPGTAASSMTWTVGEPEEDGSFSTPLKSSVIHDANGNAVSDGTLVTVVVEGGTISVGDADLNEPGMQLMVSGGCADLIVATASRDSVFTVTTYADAAMSILIGKGTYSPAQYAATPGPGVFLLLVAFLPVFWLAASRVKAVKNDM